MGDVMQSHSPQGRAVVIEDDVEIRNIVIAVLRRSGFDVHSGATGREGVEVVRSNTPTVVTLDVGLPDIDGYEVLRRIREVSDCYVIMLSARADEHDILTGLQSGADEYLTKPFRPRELRARIDAMLRRPRAPRTPRAATPARSIPVPVSTPAPEPAPALRTSAALSHGGLVLDPETRTAQIAHKELTLTRSEFDLLHEMLRSNGAVRTKSTLAGVIRGEDYRGYSYVSEADQRAVEVHMGNLRRKIQPHLGPIEIITTVRGIGYRIIPLPTRGPKL